ncbi:MAG: hypothetical protein HOV87_11820 [Catenulispora sp.]|nr:hypothetical protein [Catenulispora sp.]NUT43934.1 hypothetical protein [Thermoactinospora sp.]
MQTWQAGLLAIATTATAATAELLTARNTLRRVRREAARDTDVLVIAAEGTVEHWATVNELRYAYPRGEGGTSTSHPLRLGPAATANAILCLTERRTSRHYALTTADIAKARAELADQLPADAEPSYIADVLIQQVVYGHYRHLHPSRLLNMDRITALVRAAGIDAYVENTGGGCATIIVGEGKLPATDDRESGYDAMVLAGPGWFDWDTTPATAYASRADFYIGPDDLGVSDTWSPPLDGTIAEAEAASAAQIIALYSTFTQPKQ